jgi:hypothetical protein
MFDSNNGLAYELLLNKLDLLLDSWHVAPGNAVSLRAGVSADEIIDEATDFVIKSTRSTPGKGLNNAINCLCVHKGEQALVTASKSEGWAKSTSDKVIEDIVSKNLNIKEYDIDKTDNKGQWVKPSTQSYAQFIRILRNWSITSQTSKMFAWIDLTGKFFFKSLNNLLAAKSVYTIDLTDDLIELSGIGGISIINEGLRYASQDINQSFKTYKYDFEEGAGGLEDLKAPKVNKLGAKTTEVSFPSPGFKSDHTLLKGYTHPLLPTKFHEARYVNSVFNFPFKIEFSIKTPIVKEGAPPNPFQPGNVISFKFPPPDLREVSEGELDDGLSNDYLILDVIKTADNGIYTSTILAGTNSAGSAEMKRFINNDDA